MIELKLGIKLILAALCDIQQESNKFMASFLSTPSNTGSKKASRTLNKQCPAPKVFTFRESIKPVNLTINQNGQSDPFLDESIFLRKKEFIDLMITNEPKPSIPSHKNPPSEIYNRISVSNAHDPLYPNGEGHGTKIHGTKFSEHTGIGKIKTKKPSLESGTCSSREEKQKIQLPDLMSQDNDNLSQFETIETKNQSLVANSKALTERERVSISTQYQGFNRRKVKEKNKSRTAHYTQRTAENDLSVGSIRNFHETLAKDRKKFFQDLLKKFSENINSEDSITYRRKIHLFSKIFDHFKIKPEEKSHFEQLLNQIAQKESSQLYCENKIGRKMQLQSRQSHTSHSSQQRYHQTIDSTPRRQNGSFTSYRHRNAIAKSCKFKQSLNRNSADLQVGKDRHEIKAKYQNAEEKIIYRNVEQNRDIENLNSEYRQLSETVSATIQEMEKSMVVDPSQRSKEQNRAEGTSPQKKIMSKFFWGGKALKQASTKIESKNETPLDLKLLKFREFLFILNFSNQLYVPLEVERYAATFKVYVGKGNNSNLIKAIVKKRFWLETTTNLKEAHLVWTQIKEERVFARQEAKPFQLAEQSHPKHPHSEAKVNQRGPSDSPKSMRFNHSSRGGPKGRVLIVKNSQRTENSQFDDECEARADRLGTSYAAQQNEAGFASNHVSRSKGLIERSSMTLEEKNSDHKQLKKSNLLKNKPLKMVKNTELQPKTSNSQKHCAKTMPRGSNVKVKEGPITFKKCPLSPEKNFKVKLDIMSPIEKLLAKVQISKYEKLSANGKGLWGSSFKNNSPGRGLMVQAFSSTVSSSCSPATRIKKSFKDRKYAFQSSNGPNFKILDEESRGRMLIHNHLPVNGILGNKKAMFYILKHFYQKCNENIFEVVPLTFHIKKGVKDQEYIRFAKKFEQQKAGKSPNYWVIKPGEFSNRGKGITCSNNLEEIRKRVRQTCDSSALSSSQKDKTIILQSYITNPLLYHNRKFDVRTFMLVTCINGKLRAYWYEEGYIRTSSYQWTLEDIEDREIHLTNDAVQKDSYAYGKYEPGNKLSYRDIQRYLDTYCSSRKSPGKQSGSPHKSTQWYSEVVPKMKKIARESIMAGSLFIDPKRLQNNFEIFGFDFMLDREKKPWLIEINTNPCLEVNCLLLERLIPNMLENAFRIAVDPLFPPPSNFTSNYKYNIAENALSYNKFELIFDEQIDGTLIAQIYKGTDPQEVLRQIEDIQEDKETFEEEGEEIDLVD